MPRPMFAGSIINDFICVNFQIGAYFKWYNSETRQCSVCCLKVTQWYIVFDRGSALETRTTTRIRTTGVPKPARVLGGTIAATMPTWMVSTTARKTSHRFAVMVWCARPGRVRGARSDSPRWSWDRMMRELNNTNFLQFTNLVPSLEQSTDVTERFTNKLPDYNDLTSHI